jgi:hypothetical protein
MSAFSGANTQVKKVASFATDTFRTAINKESDSPRYFGLTLLLIFAMAFTPNVMSVTHPETLIMLVSFMKA